MTTEEQKEQKARGQSVRVGPDFHVEKMNGAHHRNAVSGMASSTGIAVGKNSADGLGLRAIVERVK